MNRRKLLFGALASGAALSCGSAIWLNIPANEHPLTINSALLKLDALKQTSTVTSGEWNLVQILSHCAQSIEFSMSGFPQHKPELFKNTLGRLAFSAFSSKGKMTHGLNEIIPGAPVLNRVENNELAFLRLRDSLVNFQNFKGKLAPHFAYGELSKSEYERAHVMHFNNHLLEVEFI